MSRILLYQTQKFAISLVLSIMALIILFKVSFILRTSIHFSLKTRIYVYSSLSIKIMIMDINKKPNSIRLRWWQFQWFTFVQIVSSGICICGDFLTCYDGKTVHHIEACWVRLTLLLHRPFLITAHCMCLNLLLLQKKLILCNPGTYMHLSLF